MRKGGDQYDDLHLGGLELLNERRCAKKVFNDAVPSIVRTSPSLLHRKNRLCEMRAHFLLLAWPVSRIAARGSVARA